MSFSKKNVHHWVVIISIMMTILFASCSYSNLEPMPAFSDITVPDGEYLHYESFENGRLYAHYYWVTKYIYDEKGELLHRTYLDVHQESRGTKPVKDYTKWGMYFDINPRTGQLVRNVSRCHPDDADNFVAVGVKDLVFWDYKLVENGVDYSYSVWNNGNEKSSHVFIDLDPKYPTSDMIWGFHFATRYLDGKDGKAAVLGVCPHLFREPIPTSWKAVKKDTIETKAGKFNVVGYKGTYFDPFIGAAISMFVPGSEDMLFWVEDTSRRLTIRINTIVGTMTLVEVSNVNEM